MSIGTFREWLREEELMELNEAIDLRDPDNYVTYDTFAKAYTNANERNINELKTILKKFKSKEEPFKVDYGGNTYSYMGQLFDSKDKKFKIYIVSPTSTDSSSSYTLMLADAPRYMSFAVNINLGVKDYGKLSTNLIIEKLKELYKKAIEKYETDTYYKKIGKLTFKTNLMNIIKS